jgi:site-specific recombinase XerD
MQKYPEGKLLRNTKGRPWTAFAVNCLMRRLAKKTGLRFAQYDLRHGRATGLLEAGVDHLTVSAVLGHVDASTLARVYSHVSKNNEHIKAALNK